MCENSFCVRHLQDDIDSLPKAVIAVCGPCPEDVVGTLIEVRRDYILLDALKEAGKAKFDSQSLLKVIFINHM